MKKNFRRHFSTERKANLNSFVFETFTLRILKEIISEIAINRNISTLSSLKSMYFFNYISLEVLLTNKKCHRKWKTVTYFLRKWQTSGLRNDIFTSMCNVKFSRKMSKMWPFVIRKLFNLSGILHKKRNKFQCFVSSWCKNK